MKQYSKYINITCFWIVAVAAFNTGLSSILGFSLFAIFGHGMLQQLLGLIVLVGAGYALFLTDLGRKIDPTVPKFVMPKKDKKQ
jgi:uncharacterized membrane protein YuzA (DUF378 family)